jgi:hypothetical protein
MTSTLPTSSSGQPQEQQVVRKHEIEGRYYVLNIEVGVLTLQGEKGEIIRQCILTDFELYLLGSLFASYPAYTPIDQLLATLTERPLNECRRKLGQLIDEEDYKAYYAMMRPVRQTVSQARKKLLSFGLSVNAIDKVGYELVSLTPQQPQPRKPTRRRQKNFLKHLRSMGVTF